MCIVQKCAAWCKHKYAALFSSNSMVLCVCVVGGVLDRDSCMCGWEWKCVRVIDKPDGLLIKTVP